MVIHLKRRIRLPDPVRLALYRRSPDLGPKILFFSGGSALKAACAEIILHSHNTIHIITPFDSGGSSASLREAFRMPAIGDIRNRLLSLADRSLHGNPEIFRLFAHRFPEDGDGGELRVILDRMIRGRHPLTAAIPDPMRKIIRRHLDRFRHHMPGGFDLRKASIGNLILTGGYLENGHHADPVIFIFSKLVQVRGIVRPVINRNLHLAVELATGETLVGQHRITGKEAAPLTDPIRKIYLSDRPDPPRPVRPPIRDKMKRLIGDADLICYPMGSFYSSLIANLLPEGVTAAIRDNPCPKVYIPNTAGDTTPHKKDPETCGMTLMDQIDRLLHYLGAGGGAAAGLLDFILLDRKNGDYVGGVDEAWLRQRGIGVIDCPLITPGSRPYIDETLLVPVLYSLP
jgi:CofD-related protein of GAK system